MENFHSMLMTVLIYNSILSVGLLIGARLVEQRLFEELKDFYTVNFSEIEIPNYAAVTLSIVILPIIMILLPFCGVVTFMAIAWMVKMRGDGYEGVQRVRGFIHYKD